MVLSSAEAFQPIGQGGVGPTLHPRFGDVDCGNRPLGRRQNIPNIRIITDYRDLAVVQLRRLQGRNYSSRNACLPHNFAA